MITTPNRITHAANTAYKAAKAERGCRDGDTLADALTNLAHAAYLIADGTYDAADLRDAVERVRLATDSHAPTDATLRAAHHADALARYADDGPTANTLADDLAAVASFAADAATANAERILRYAERYGDHEPDDTNRIYQAWRTAYAYRALARYAPHAVRRPHPKTRRAIWDAIWDAYATEYWHAGDDGVTALAIAGVLAANLANAPHHTNLAVTGGLDPRPEDA